MIQPSLRDLVNAISTAPARAGERRIVLIDGPAGSGKSTLARALAQALGAPVLHGDDMYEGWFGLTTLWSVLGDQVLEPWAQGKPAAFQRWDWATDQRGEVIAVEPAPVLIIEGVGVAQRQAREFASTVVWVEVEPDLSITRGLERDGEHMRGHWEAWQRTEREHFATDATRAAADVMVDGSTPLASDHP